MKPSILTVLLAGSLVSCASFEHTKGQVLLKFDQQAAGIEALEKASRLSPRDAEYKIDHLLKRDQALYDVLAAADALRSHGKLADAEAAYQAALKMDRGSARALAGLANLAQDARNLKLMAEDAQLAKGKAGSVLEKPVSLQFNDAPLRTVFESLSRSVGLNVLVDRDVKPAARVTIFVKDITVADAVDFILMQNQLERRVVNSNTIVVYPSLDAKRAEYEDLTIRSFQVTNADIKYLSTMLKSMLKLREVTADERSGVLVVRDTPEKISLAAKLIAVHDVADPEIMLEIEILEVANTRQSNLGLLPPGGITVSTPASAGALALGALKQLRTNELLVSPLAATLNFKLEDIDARLLASPRIRARNKEKAKIMIGDRVPTITNSVTPINTGSSVVTGNVTYQDVGLKLEFESQVYADNEVGIKLSLEVSNIAAYFTDPQGGRSYQIGTRNAATNLRLKDGETQILGGLITEEDRNTATKIPGVGHLPVVGRLFGNNQGNTTTSEIVLAITPRIVRNLPERSNEVRSIFSGTMNVMREKPILAEALNELKFAAPAVQAGQPPAAQNPPPNFTPGPAPAPLPPPPAIAPRSPASR